jgi:hypothetical protein
MTKLSVARVFDTSVVANTKAFTELSKFFEYMAQFTDNMSRIVRNGISVSDNLDARVITQDLRHNQESVVSINRRPVLVLLGRQSPVSSPITSFTWTLNDAGNLVLKITLANPADTQPITVTLLAIFS